MASYRDDQDNWVEDIPGTRIDVGRAMGQFALVAGVLLLLRWGFGGNKATVWGLIRLAVGLVVLGYVLYFFGLVIYYGFNPDAG